MPYIIYTDIEYLIKKRWICKQSRKFLSNKNRGAYSLRIFNVNNLQVSAHVENKHILYHGKDCIKKFCESLREHAKNVIDLEKKKILPLTKEELK